MTSATPRALDAKVSPLSAKVTVRVLPSPTHPCAGVSSVQGAVAESTSAKPKFRATTELPTSARGVPPLTAIGKRSRTRRSTPEKPRR